MTEFVRTYRRLMTFSALNQRRSEDSQAPAPSQLLFARTFFGAAFFCAVLVFAVYSPSLNFQFVLDDHAFTAHSSIVQPGHIWEYFANSTWAQFAGGPASFYRPVFLVWMRVNFLLSGLSPWGWHLLSICKHLVVAVLLGVLVWNLLRNSTVALMAATLFALHPAQSESVSWVTVPDPLMAAGVLIALLCYLEYLKRASITRPMSQPTRRSKSRRSSSAGTDTRHWPWLAASGAAYLLALMSKETAIVFPAVIFALSLYPASNWIASRGRSTENRWTGALRQTLPFLILSGIYFLLRLAVLGNMLGAATQHLPWSTVVRSWPGILCFYLKVLLWPVKSYAFADPIVIENFSARGVLLPLAALACAAAILAAFGLWIAQTAKRELDQQSARGIEHALTIGMLLVLLPLLPALNVNGLNPGDFLHGRYTYLSLAGMMLLAATGLRIIERSRLLLLGAAAVLAMAFAALTLAQEKQWQDDATVFAVAHELAPHNAAVARHFADTHVQAALQLDEEGRCAEALPIFDQVIRDFPDDWFAWAGQGDCYVQLNDLPKAEESLHRASDLAHSPQVTEHWQELRVHMGLPNAAPAN